MKVIIEGIRRLKDGTVSCVVTTDAANYVPLVMLDEQARSEGRDIELTIRQESVQESAATYDEFLTFLKSKLSEIERISYEKGLMDAVQGHLNLKEKGEA